MIRSMTIALLAVWCSAGLAIAQADVSGSWSFTTDNPQGINERSMALEQDGSTLTGTTTSDNGATASVSGNVSGSEVELRFDVPAGLTVIMTGTVDGSTMSGTIDFGGQASGSFTASKE